MALLDASQTFDDVKRLILNYVETRINFEGVAPMDVGNLDFYDQWNDHHQEEIGEYENQEVYMLHNGGKAKGKGKGKQRFQGQCSHCGEWGHKAVQCQKRLTCWTCGELGHRSAECPKGKGKGKVRWQGPVRAVTHQQRALGQGFQQGLCKQYNMGCGKGSFSKGKGPYGNGATYGKSNIGASETVTRREKVRALSRYSTTPMDPRERNRPLYLAQANPCE